MFLHNHHIKEASYSIWEDAFESVVLFRMSTNEFQLQHFIWSLRLKGLMLQNQIIHLEVKVGN